ncbi:MAG: FimB/Mfa2 family fimbrial subunit [Alistipes sp.]|nr:FimB/Mfa2 family fimbrial subunit [Alistipes sp.]
MRNTFNALIYRMTCAPIRTAAAVAAALLLVACGGEKAGCGADGDDALISLSVSAASRSINEDTELWEDRVDELRMLVFDPDDGSVVINQKLYFPDGFDRQSRAVRMDPGTYDFYFIANETAAPASFVTALADITNVSDFRTDTRFTAINYDTDFLPDGTTTEGRFPMSAVYEGITVASGGTEANPVLLPLPTSTVELIRAYAKVEVVFRKNVPGSEISNTVTSVELTNIAATYSLPPDDATYTGRTLLGNGADLTGFDYGRDSIGAVTFYIPEFLVPEGGETYTQLAVNNNLFPIENDAAFGGLADQRRTVTGLSANSVIRNYHYIINAYINAEGGVQIKVFVEPWSKETYLYMFQGDLSVVIPPVYPTDSSIIIPTECGNVEILSENEYLTQGLMGAYNYVINWWNPETQGPEIIGGDPPYYCENKYGEGWRLINACELLSFLAFCDIAYDVWTSNTWLADGWDMPYYPLPFRQEAQSLLESLTGYDLSSTILYNENNHQDVLADEKLGIIDNYFTPGDILLKTDDFPDG